jgi:replicative DNA helicase
LQNLAQSINVPIIAFSQLNNDSIKNQSEAIGYKGSGDIANSADLGLELRLDEDDKEVMKRKQASGEPYKVKLVVRKSRHGKMGTQDLLFENRIGKFYEV